MKTLKNENEELVKEGNAISVSLKSRLKDSELSKRNSEKEIEAYKVELANLLEYKIQQEEEVRKARKLEKKMRQKEKKKASKAGDKVLEKSDIETTKAVSADNTAESEEQVKPIAKKMSESFEDEKLSELRTKTCEQIDNENNLEHEKETEASIENKPKLSELEIKKIQGFIFRSKEPRFYEFPEQFEDWSEEQKSDAYENNFEFYLQKSFKPYGLFAQ